MATPTVQYSRRMQRYGSESATVVYYDSSSLLHAAGGTRHCSGSFTTT
jgi:hypothetical protein